MKPISSPGTRARRTLMAVAWLGLALVGRTQTVGPVSAYFLTAGDQNHLLVVQGATVTGTFTVVSSNREYPLFVLNNAVRTLGPMMGETGREYTFAGATTGTVLTSALASGGSAWDATTDGKSAYLLDYSLGIVYRTGLDYSNPVALFSGLGSSTFLGITYDSTNDSLWISGWSSSEIRNYSMSGTLLSSFTGPASSLTSLALDPATGTLWMGSQGQQGHFWEYSRTGTQLQSLNLPSLASENTLGGEFAFTAVPEPSTWVLLGGGVALLALSARRQRRPSR